MPSDRIDRNAQYPANERVSPAARWIDRSIVVFLLIFAIFAPHSIAITQTAWLIGMLLWVVRFAFYPPPSTFRTPLDYALIGFFVLSGISSFFSYAPLVSIGKMRAASLFTIVYLLAQNVPSLRIMRLLAITLIVSCTINVLFTCGVLAIGRGVKLQGVQKESPLATAVFHTRTEQNPTPILSGDTIIEVDGRRVSDAGELAAALVGNSYVRPGSAAQVKIYRVEWTPTLEVPRRLLPGSTAEEQLGISGWTRGRDFRATGFFGHWVTYAEVLQLIASLTLGLFLCLRPKRGWAGALLLLALAGFIFALALTTTRASWLGFLISAALMLLLTASRRTLIIVGFCAIPLVLAGLFFLQQKRNVGFFDRNDQSTSWRETVWREGFQLLVSKPRHLLVGVGLDSIKSHWRQWGLFDNGRLPMGHMHSDLLQIALERGVPALLLWLVLLGMYARMLWKLFRGTRDEGADIKVESAAVPPKSSRYSEWLDRNHWIDRGVILGALGGLAGFFSSGLVHYNWGDSEVVMVFYFMMGLSLIIEREKRTSRLARVESTPSRSTLKA